MLLCYVSWSVDLAIYSKSLNRLQLILFFWRSNYWSWSLKLLWKQCVIRFFHDCGHLTEICALYIALKFICEIWFAKYNVVVVYELNVLLLSVRWCLAQTCFSISGKAALETVSPLRALSSRSKSCTMSLVLNSALFLSDSRMPPRWTT